MEYRVVYDVTTEGPAVWFPAGGLVFVAIGVLLWRFRDQMIGGWHGPFRSRPGWRKAFAGVFLGFSVVWTVIASIGVLGSHFAAKRTLSRGGAAVVEGIVQDFHPMPYAGHDTERFTVSGVRFAYSDYIVGPGFNNTSSHGGPIREGVAVRIHYSGSREHATILKLEIKEE